MQFAAAAKVRSDGLRRGEGDYLPMAAMGRKQHHAQLGGKRTFAALFIKGSNGHLDLITEPRHNKASGLTRRSAQITTLTECDCDCARHLASGSS